MSKKTTRGILVYDGRRYTCALCDHRYGGTVPPESEFLAHAREHVKSGRVREITRDGQPYFALAAALR